MAEVLQTYTEYQMDRAFNLASVNKGFGIVREVLGNYPEGVILPIRNSKGYQGQQLVNPQFAFGMYICMRSLYKDLVEEDLQMLALDIIGTFK